MDTSIQPIHHLIRQETVMRQSSSTGRNLRSAFETSSTFGRLIRIAQIRYIPTRIISILAIALFGIALVLHAFRVVRRGTRAFSILMVVGILLEIVGYVFRLKSSEPPFGNPYNVVNFVVQYFFIVVAPVMFSAAIYVVLTYLIVALGDQYRPFGLGKILILGLFVACDVASTIVQVAGPSS